MGQPVAVTLRPTATAGRVRFDLNRSLTGMGHERYASIDEARGATPGAELARRLFGRGAVRAVHVYSNTVTVDLAAGVDATTLVPLVEELYRHWQPGMVPKVG
ncbi:MAG: hypothetical protein ACO3IV_06940 [Ilumatobacteraceae bacterium]